MRQIFGRAGFRETRRDHLQQRLDGPLLRLLATLSTHPHAPLI